MKKKISNLQEEYKKTLSDSSSTILKLIKLESFKEIANLLKHKEDKNEVKKVLLTPDDNADNKLISEILFKVVFKEEFKKIATKMSYEDFNKYKESHINSSYTDYFFEVANKEIDLTGNIDVNEEI